jgi:hypothetical protein
MVLVGVISQGFPLLVVNREFQPTYLALKSPASKTGNPPPKQASRSAPVGRRQGERYTARIITEVACQHSLYGSCLNMGQTRNVH